MTDTESRSIRNLLAWVAERPRSYAETMAAWRSTCPRLSVWEDALLDGLLATDRAGRVLLTEAGRTRLERRRPAAPKHDLPEAAAASRAAAGAGAGERSRA